MIFARNLRFHAALSAAAKITPIRPLKYYEYLLPPEDKTSK